MSKQFIWLERNSYANGNVLLEHGKTYKVADLGDAVVSWWIKQGAAESVDSKPKKSKGE